MYLVCQLVSINVVLVLNGRLSLVCSSTSSMVLLYWLLLLDLEDLQKASKVNLKGLYSLVQTVQLLIYYISTGQSY